MPDLLVRPYLPSDRSTLFRVAADTAFFGDPVETYLDDRNVFLDAFYAYYTDFEPEHAWVACADGELVGFLTGCIDTRRQERLWPGAILPAMLGRLLRGRYRFGRRTLDYFSGWLGNVLSSGSLRTDLNLFPAHLHINLGADWRGFGLGRRLMESYLDQLRSLRVKGVHLHTTSHNEAACRLYEKIGFRIQDAKPDRFWGRVLRLPVESRCYGLALT